MLTSPVARTHTYWILSEMHHPNHNCSNQMHTCQSWGDGGRWTVSTPNIRFNHRSREKISVQWLSYEMDDLGIGVPERTAEFCLADRDKTGSEAQPASNATNAWSFFPGSKATWGVKSSSHLILLPRTKTRAAIQPIASTSSWRGDRRWKNFTST
jgi:hypothetical protein